MIASLDIAVYRALLMIDPSPDIGVENDTDPKWDSIYRSVYNKPTLLRIPWYITLGNHDRYATTRGQGQIDYYLNKRDTRWYLPAAWYTNTFTVNTTTIQFVMYDSSVFIATDVNDTLVYHIHFTTQRCNISSTQHYIMYFLRLCMHQSLHPSINQNRHNKKKHNKRNG
jgi:hypothetical protein